MSSINIVLPVKDLDFCKTRLASILTLSERQQLVLSLLKQNIKILQRDFKECHILIITPDDRVSDLAKSLHVTVLKERMMNGLNRAIKAGTRWSMARGYQTQLVLAPDIAVLDKDELAELFDQENPSSIVTLAVANDGGTNALLTCPPNIIPPKFGEQSAQKMSEISKQRGITCQSLYLPHLSLDIDQPNDLLQWQSQTITYASGGS